MTTTQLILSVFITVVGSVYWYWRRYHSKSAEIARKKKRIGEILREQMDALENNDMLLFNFLDTERLRLSESIRRIRG